MNEWTSVTCNHATLLHHEREHTQAHTSIYIQYTHFDTSLNSIHVNHFRYPFRLDRFFCIYSFVVRACALTRARSFFLCLCFFFRFFRTCAPVVFNCANTLRIPLSFGGVVFVLFHRFSFCILCIKLLLVYVYFGYCCCCCYCCFVFCCCFFFHSTSTNLSTMLNWHFLT